MGSSAGHAGEDRSSVCMGLGGVERLGAGVSLITRAQASQGRATDRGEQAASILGFRLDLQNNYRAPGHLFLQTPTKYPTIILPLQAPGKMIPHRCYRNFNLPPPFSP